MGRPGRSPLADVRTADRVLYVGRYPGVTVVCSGELTVAHPSRLAQRWARPNALFLGADAEKSWGAYAIWENGTLRRSFSATDVTILEDEGLPLVWELPFWSGERPIERAPGVIPDPQSLPFDPRELADEARERVLGTIDPTAIMLCRFDIYDPADAPRPEPEPAPPPPIVAAPPPPKRRWFRRKRR